MSTLALIHTTAARGEQRGGVTRGRQKKIRREVGEEGSDLWWMPKDKQKTHTSLVEPDRRRARARDFLFFLCVF